MSSMFERASKAFRRGKNAEDTQRQDEEGESLTTILPSAEDRSALTLLICNITEVMRKQIVDTFDARETGETQQEDQFTAHDQEDGGDGNDNKNEDEAERTKQLEKALEKQKADLAKREKEVSDEKLVTLKAAALNYFDDWRDSVVLRVGEVVNSKKEAEDQPQQPNTESASLSDAKALDGQETKKSDYDDKINEAALRQYPPVETPLRSLDKAKKALLLHSALLLMLSLEHYRAHSRTLLLYLTTSLGLSVSVLAEDEGQVAQGLLAAAEKMSANDETKKRADENRTARRIKMGAAGVAGAALIGITGGLAAPFLAAGLGTVLGGLGLGATATAGLLGTLAGSGALVGSVFGAYGARMTSKAMEKYTRDVEDFAFVPVAKQDQEDPESHRLRVAIGVSGWLRDKEDAVLPWKIIGSGQEAFALRFEMEALMNLGNALTTLITSVAWKVAKSEIIKRTVFAALMAGLWPISLTNVGRIIDNPWVVANQRAQKAGEVLADALINKAQGERPVTLIGYSLGAKVIYFCLQQLAERKAFGLVENAILLGAPTPSNSSEWRRIRAVVTGRVVNAYSAKDYILAYLYRTSSIQFGVAGLHPVLNVKGVENVDIADIVEGHTLYRYAAGPTLERIGFMDLDIHEVKHEDQKLKEQEKVEESQREAAEKAAGDDGSSDEELRRMEQQLEQKNKESSIEHKMEAVKVSEKGGH
ncbi:DUF726-domain-containing protein [Xylariaceae sp. FL0016]|nr:DUF726-domain-containing protein [Xylariaceae sp. FL0016]